MWRPLIRRRCGSSCTPEVAGHPACRRRGSGGPVAAGLAVVLAIPLRHGDQMLGVLHLHRNPPAPLSAAATRTAQTLADVAAAYLLNAHTRQDREPTSDLAHHVYLHDRLTGLPNRALLLERLTQAFHRSRRTNAVAAELDLDWTASKPSTIDTGAPPVTALLVALARRLSVLLRPADTLAWATPRRMRRPVPRLAPLRRSAPHRPPTGTGRHRTVRPTRRPHHGHRKCRSRLRRPIHARPRRGPGQRRHRHVPGPTSTTPSAITDPGVVSRSRGGRRWRSTPGCDGQVEAEVNRPILADTRRSCYQR